MPRPGARFSKLLIMKFSPLLSYLIPLKPKYSPQHPILNTFSLRASLNVSDQFSHPYKTTDKIIGLYILFFQFLGRKQEDKRFCTEW
jgi:hypothetical protein